jgi:hypothetical protein
MTQTLNKTNRDTTIEEIHKVREKISDTFNGDIQAILEDAQKRQESSNRKTVSFADDYENSKELKV